MSANEPVNSWSASTGRPATRSPRPMPSTSGTVALPRIVAHVHTRCQRGARTLSRNSKDTPRAMSAISTSSSPRYRPENRVAYQAGNAANIAAPATISHTSLPSQNGPMALRARRRPSSSRPTAVCSTPTPKSNPSSTKNPVQNTATTTNHSVSSDMSVGERRHRGARLGHLGRQLAPGVAQHQHEIRDAQRHEQQREHAEADPDLGHAD